MSTGSIRPAAVAGIFYPSDAIELKELLSGFLERGRLALVGRESATTRALVAPHAGYRFSGAVAGVAYASLRSRATEIDRVILFSPSHRVAFSGIALSSARQFETPLGRVEIDVRSSSLVAALPFAQTMDAAHAEEHGIEVHLPFLQLVLPRFKLLPLVVGECQPEQIVELIERLEPLDRSLILVSSDLSHYLDSETARELDGATAAAIEAGAPESVPEGGACGIVPLRALLSYANSHNLSAETLELRTSADVGGSKDRVVGYGAFRFVDADLVSETTGEEPLSSDERQALLEAAKHALVYAAQTEQELPIQLLTYSDALLEFRSSFVTLKQAGELRGCIGSLFASRPLVEDVVHNAYGAAILDKRFSPLRESELPGLEIHISLLSPIERLEARSEKDVLALLRPDVDGVMLQYQDMRGSFLPVMWKRFTTPHELLSRLKEKAGLSADFWAPQVEVFRFAVIQEIHGHL
ncbi:MAG: AmmeMemoRadiSam system protein B [Bdellovibrionota bacterium]